MPVIGFDLEIRRTGYPYTTTSTRAPCPSTCPPENPRSDSGAAVGGAHDYSIYSAKGAVSGAQLIQVHSVA